MSSALSRYPECRTFTATPSSEALPGRSHIALTLLRVFYAHGGFDGALTIPQQSRFLNTLSS
jgi:hypothetical protein